MIKEFLAFLKSYGVIGLAIAVVIGGKVNELVKSFVDNLVMPLMGMVIPDGNWRSFGFEIAGARFGVGPFLGAFVDFSIVGLIVFIFCKKILKEEVVTKK